MGIVTCFKLAISIVKGGVDMVAVYVSLIVYKRRTIDQVPAQLKDAVLADLNAMGLDGYGQPLETAA
ncbi:MAG TPA: CD1375 family protein [Candidatus Nitrosocosmicus sp.]|nr:CD1375 family protein [Candidatus Nitrosocosmicus sp.]